jgi:hypothetical protein
LGSADGATTEALAAEAKRLRGLADEHLSVYPDVTDARIEEVVTVVLRTPTEKPVSSNTTGPDVLGSATRTRDGDAGAAGGGDKSPDMPYVSVPGPESIR